MDETLSLANSLLGQTNLSSFNSSIIQPTGAISGLLGGAQNYVGPIAGTSTSLSGTQDMRVRLKAPVGAESQVYGPNDPSNILAILYKTNGIVFPYTPSIQESQDVDYRAVDLSQSNGDILTYSRTPSVTLSVSGKFTVQNQREGQYALAVLHLLRVASKMYFGDQDYSAGKAGTPPTPLNFSGYGTYMYNNLRVLLRNHSVGLEDSVDYVRVAVGSGYVQLPALFQVTMSLTVNQTPQEMRQQFSLDQFRTGALMTSSTVGWL